LSTGDLLRSAVADGSSLGREADGYMRAGRLVPDDLVLKILRDRLARPDAAHGFILDGFPRTIAQARALEQLTPLDAVVSFDVDPEALVERLAGRRLCPSCGSVYNVTTQPPRSPGRCDRDGTELAQRPDDRPEAVRVRLAVYRDQTAPLLDHYAAAGVLRSLDASGPPPVVADRLRHLLGAGGAARPGKGRSGGTKRAA
jgi:adenylate kinase